MGGWDRKRRCDQNYEDENGVRGCQPCEGIGGHAYGDGNDEIDFPPCEVVAHAKSEKFLLPKPVHPVYPKKFTVWTDPRTGHIVRAWQPFNGLQVYNPDSWKEGIEDETVFEYPPAMCKGPAAGQNETIWRINCDDDGNFNGTPPPPEGLGHAISEQWKQMAEAHKLKNVVV